MNTPLLILTYSGSFQPKNLYLMTYHSRNSAGCMDLIKVNQLLSTTRLILSFQIRSDQDESIILNRFSCSFNLMVDLGPAPAIDFDCFQGAMM
jgi:hypothetical protein